MGTGLIREWVIEPEQRCTRSFLLLQGLPRSRLPQRLCQNCLQGFSLIRPRKLDQAGIDGVGEHRSEYCVPESERRYVFMAFADRKNCDRGVKCLKMKNINSRVQWEYFQLKHN